MSKRTIGWAVIGMIAAGCQSPSSAPVPPPAAPQQQAVAPPQAQPTPPDPRASAVIRQTQQHVQAASEAKFEPPPSAAPATSVQPPTPPPAPAKPVLSPRPDAGGAPIKSIESLISEGVAFTPPNEAAASTPAAAPPPATVISSEEVVAPPPVAAPPAAPVHPTPTPRPSGELRAKVEERARSSPNDFAAQIDAQLLRVLSDQPPAKSDTFASLDPEDRDVLLGLVDGVANFRAQVQRDPNVLPNRKIRPLLDMAERLRAKADLAIVNPCLVTKVRGFGSYDAVEPLRLPAGIANRPAIYYEIENFSSRIDEKGQYRTTMRQDVTIYDVNGASVYEWPNEPVIDVCRRQRHDFHFAKIVRTPINLMAGSYTIKITLTDAQRMAEASLPLVVTPPPGTPPTKVYGPTGPVGGAVGPGGVR